MARDEKPVTAQLELEYVHTFLPRLHEIHRWSDRRGGVEIRMFSCYAFDRIVQVVDERLKVPRTPGVIDFVGSEREGTPIPDQQIESLRTAISERIPCSPHLVSAGNRVRISGGSPDGVEGIFVL